MKLKEDQLRIKDLLKDTITLLCKNGLQYKGGFCVEALIGITLDDEDVFLVNIKETVQNENAKESQVEVNVQQAGEEDESEEGDPLHTPQKQKQRSARKRPPDASPATSDLPSPAKQIRTETDDASNASEMSKDSMFNIKAEPHDDDDLVFIKEEGNDFSSSCSQSQAQPGVPYIMGDVRSQQTAMVTTQGYPQNPDFSQSFNTTSADSLPGMSSWDPNQSNIGALNTSNQSFSSADNQQQMAAPGMHICQYCCQIFKRKQYLTSHLRGRHGIGSPLKCPCGRVFKAESTMYVHMRHCDIKQRKTNVEEKSSVNEATTEGKQENVSNGASVLSEFVEENVSEDTGGQVQNVENKEDAM